MTTSRTTISAVDELLDAIAAGAGRRATDLYADGAVLDATVPGWRYFVRGRQSIGEQFAEWFAATGCFDELERRPTSDGEVVTYLLTWTENGVPHAAHHSHTIALGDDGRIVRDTFFCGGRWDAALLARMTEADRG